MTSFAGHLSDLGKPFRTAGNKTKNFVGGLWDDVTGVTAADAAGDAAQLQYQSTQDALAQNKGIYDQNREDMMPWLESGSQNLDYLNQLMSEGAFDPQEFSFDGSNIMDDPGYQFALDSVDRGAAAKGGLRSGATDVDLMRAGGNQFQQAFNRAFNTHGTNQSGKNNFFNKLAGMSGTGQSQSQSMGNMGSMFGNNQSNMMTGGADALASGIVGGANARTQGTTNLLNLLMQGGGLVFG